MPAAAGLSALGLERHDGVGLLGVRLRARHDGQLADLGLDLGRRQRGTAPVSRRTRRCSRLPRRSRRTSEQPASTDREHERGQRRAATGARHPHAVPLPPSYALARTLTSARARDEPLRRRTTRSAQRVDDLGAAGGLADRDQRVGGQRAVGAAQVAQRLGRACRGRRAGRGRHPAGPMPARSSSADSTPSTRPTRVVSAAATSETKTRGSSAPSTRTTANQSSSRSSSSSTGSSPTATARSRSARSSRSLAVLDVDVAGSPPAIASGHRRGEVGHVRYLPGPAVCATRS